MKPYKINFTKTTISNIESPHNSRKYIYDTHVSCLGVMVFPSGTKTFFLYKRINNKPSKVKLGKFPEMSVEQARKAAYAVTTQINNGIDPNQEKKSLRTAIIYSELFAQYIDKYAKLHKKTWKQDSQIYKSHFKPLYNKNISSINQLDITKWHKSLGQNKGVYAANRALALLRTTYNKAIAWGWAGNNPTSGIKMFKEKSRERFLQFDELPKFFNALNNEPNELFRDYFYITLLTGARRRTVGSMNWQDINLPHKTWTIHETKNGESQIIHLSEHATSILHRRLKSKTSIWVFPSSTSASGHIEEPKKAWQRIITRAGIINLRIHDLRRTLGSWQAATGANSYIIGKSLGHKTQQATAIYARLNLDPVRESVNRATEAMFATIKQKQKNL